MRYNLWHDKVIVGDVTTDKPLVRGDIVQTAWRVVDAAWTVDARDNTNTRSSGDVLVEPVNPEHIAEAEPEDATPPREFVTTGVRTRRPRVLRRPIR
jgi:hypothetical protein